MPSDGDYGRETSRRSRTRPACKQDQARHQRWAIFPHEGHVTTIASTIDAVFTQALPAAGLTPGDLPDLLERYDERFDPWSGGGGFEIWVPVKEGFTRTTA